MPSRNQGSVHASSGIASSYLHITMTITIVIAAAIIMTITIPSIVTVNNS